MWSAVREREQSWLCLLYRLGEKTEIKGKSVLRGVLLMLETGQDAPDSRAVRFAEIPTRRRRQVREQDKLQRCFADGGEAVISVGRKRGSAFALRLRLRIFQERAQAIFFTLDDECLLRDFP